MNQKNLLEDFEAERSRLQAVAYRMLGSFSEADDAVQEVWLRLNRTDVSDVGNLGGWLTTVTARVCLDMLRSRKSRREESLEAPQARERISPARNPEQEALIADSIGLAMLVVLQRLSPAERIAFVLHDMFDLSFDEIAPIVGRSEMAARQLASRARRRVQGAPALPEPDIAQQRGVVEAFLAASRGGDFEALLAVLDPNVVLRADNAAVKFGGPEHLQGAPAVAQLFMGRARLARPALVDGAVGALVAPQGKLFLVLRLSIADGKIVEIEAVADREALDSLDLAVLTD